MRQRGTECEDSQRFSMGINDLSGAATLEFSLCWSAASTWNLPDSLECATDVGVGKSPEESDRGPDSPLPPPPPAEMSIREHQIRLEMEDVRLPQCRSPGLSLQDSFRGCDLEVRSRHASER